MRRTTRTERAFGRNLAVASSFTLAAGSWARHRPTLPGGPVPADGDLIMDLYPDFLTQSLPASALSAADLMLRLGMAAICGAVLGIDREVQNKPLGWRTYMLVSLGAASFSVLMTEMVHTFDGDNLQLDPTRIVEGVIGGIGFLGAAAIIQERGQLRGATTGAGIWMVGAIGMASGFGFYLHALIMTGFAALVITVLGLLTGWLQRERAASRTHDAAGHGLPECAPLGLRPR
jgi:putative Mg2+ transporter-C (MgtC) family protein